MPGERLERRPSSLRLFVAIAGIGIAGPSGMAEMVAAGRARMALARFYSQDSHRTLWKALVFEGGKRRRRREKEDTSE